MTPAEFDVYETQRLAKVAKQIKERKDSEIFAWIDKWKEEAAVFPSQFYYRRCPFDSTQSNAGIQHLNTLMSVSLRRALVRGMKHGSIGIAPNAVVAGLLPIALVRVLATKQQHRQHGSAHPPNDHVPDDDKYPFYHHQQQDPADPLYSKSTSYAQYSQYNQYYTLPPPSPLELPRDCCQVEGKRKKMVEEEGKMERVEPECADPSSTSFPAHEGVALLEWRDSHYPFSPKKGHFLENPLVLRYEYFPRLRTGILQLFDGHYRLARLIQLGAIFVPVCVQVTLCDLPQFPVNNDYTFEQLLRNSMRHDIKNASIHQAIIRRFDPSSSSGGSVNQVYNFLPSEIGLLSLS